VEFSVTTHSAAAGDKVKAALAASSGSLTTDLAATGGELANLKSVTVSSAPVVKNTPAGSTAGEDEGMGAGAVAGIVIGVLVVCVGCVVVGYLGMQQMQKGGKAGQKGGLAGKDANAEDQSEVEMEAGQKTYPTSKKPKQGDDKASPKTGGHKSVKELKARWAMDSDES